MCSDFYKQNTFLHNYLKICTTYATKAFFCQCERLSTPVIFSVSLKKNEIMALSTGQAKAMRFAIPWSSELVCAQ